MFNMNSSGAVMMQVADKPDVAPPPFRVGPTQATDAEASVQMAVNGSPEEDVLIFPLLGDEVRIGKQVV